MSEVTTKKTFLHLPGCRNKDCQCPPVSVEVLQEKFFHFGVEAAAIREQLVNLVARVDRLHRIFAALRKEFEEFES